MATMTAYQAYRTMKWTTDQDLCEGCGTIVLSEGNYVEGRFGHYCSDACCRWSEDDGISDADERASERRQMGIC